MILQLHAETICHEHPGHPLIMTNFETQNLRPGSLMADISSTGTLQQCSSAIDHLKRIIKYKAPALNQDNAKRRIPRLVANGASTRPMTNIKRQKCSPFVFYQGLSS